MRIDVLCDHIEIDHERELAPGTTYARMAHAHRTMHQDDHRFVDTQWNHYHRNGQTIFK